MGLEKRENMIVKTIMRRDPLTGGTSLTSFELLK